MTAVQGTEALRAELAAAIARFIEAVERQPDAAFLQARDGRTPRDIVAHLIGWNWGAVAMRDELRRGESPACLTDPGPNFSRVNGLSMAKYPSRNKAELLGQLRESAAAYDAMLGELPDAEWHAERGFALGDWPITNANLAAALVHDFSEHRAEIEGWTA
jgi:hypothetical protein